MGDQKNMILFLAISVAILLGWEVMFGTYTQPPARTGTEQVAGDTSGTVPANRDSATNGTTPSVPGDITPTPETAAETALGIDAELSAGRRIAIRNKRFAGSLLLEGGLVDDITLTDYKATLEPDSVNIEMLGPRQSSSPYYVRHGWHGEGVKVPGATDRWSADRQTLTPEHPLTLTWDNGEGLVFKRVLSIDENYMFTVTQTVENRGESPANLYPYAIISRTNTPPTTGIYVLHEGPMGVMGGSLNEATYEDLEEDGKVEEETTGGWVGISDKYWLAAVIPDQSQPVIMRMQYFEDAGRKKYQTDYLAKNVVTIAPGNTASVTGHMFLGAKEVRLLDGYETDLGIINFDLAIDFGWFYFLTKPIFLGLLWISSHVGNMGVSILIMTLLIKIALFPLANKSYKAMSRMKALQPEMMKLRERFGEDKPRLNQETMALYKREKVNPASGCLPILVQIPIFFALYKVLYVNIEMRHAPFFGWIADLSERDPTTIFNLFGLIPWTPPDFMHLGIWPLIMGFTMWLQQQLNPKPTDQIQATMMRWLPVIFTFLLANFPAGLVIYWAWNNALSIAQQWLIMRKMGVKAG